MTEIESAIFNLMTKIFGNSKFVKKDSLQIEFNCPTKYCSHDTNKYNLGVNLQKNIFHCWKCGYSGFIYKIIRDYGNIDDQNKIELILPKQYVKYISSKSSLESFFATEKQINNITLPIEYVPLYDDNKIKSRHYYSAIEYLKRRNISEQLIRKYKIGYAEDGEFKYRIIVPSFGNDGQLNYFIGRAFYDYVKPKYLTLKEPLKKDIIFNEYFIDYHLPMYLVEGVFDMLPIYNCVPLLGKTVHDLLFNKLIKYKCKVTVCLDDDAKVDAYEMVNQLASFGIDADYITPEQDISFINQKYNKEHLIKTLGNRKRINFKDFVLDRLDKKSITHNHNQKSFDYDLKKIKENLK